MAGYPQYEADRLDGAKGIRASEKQSFIEAQLRATANVIPAHIWYATPSGALIFVNSRIADYIGLPKDHPLRRGIDSGSEWDSHIHFLHPYDQEETRRVWSNCLRTGGAGEVAFRVRNAKGEYRWFLSRAEPLRASDGKVLRWYAACTDIEDRKRAEERLKRENAALREELNQASMFEEIVGSSEPLRKVLSQVSKVALSDSTVLILGQTGTGKELIARAIHKRSNRAGRAFIGVNCGAIPTSLIASELFGHEKGAFTGATQRRLGRFEAANGGTIFLDEVGDLPSDTFSIDEAWLKREPSAVPHPNVALNGVLLAHEKEVIEAALGQSHGRISGPAGAAAKLGIPDSTLEAKIKRLGIDKYRFKSQVG